MTIQDFLEGEKTVLIKRDNEDIELEITDEDHIEEPGILPKKVIQRLEDEGYIVEEPFPLEIEIYIHDDKGPSEKRKIQDKLNIHEETGLAQSISDIGYEIPITIRVLSKSSFEIVSVFDEELASPKKIRVRGKQRRF